MNDIAGDSSLGLYIKKANIGEMYEKFPSLNKVEMKLEIQRGIILNNLNSSLIGNFAFSLFGLDNTYFMNQDMQMTLNGMDTKGESLENIKFHKDIEYLGKFSKMRSGAGPIDYFSIYVLESDKNGLCLREVLRWDTDTKADFKDRILYIDESHVKLPF